MYGAWIEKRMVDFGTKDRGHVKRGSRTVLVNDEEEAFARCP